VNSLDRYKGALWFLNRGDECLTAKRDSTHLRKPTVASSSASANPGALGFYRTSASRKAGSNVMNPLVPMAELAHCARIERLGIC